MALSISSLALRIRCVSTSCAVEREEGARGGGEES
jgi:hypothetical protein